MELELTMSGGKPENTTHLHWRAVKDLSPQLVDEFQQRASALHAEMHASFES